MSVAHAKIKCPELILVPSRMNVYRDISKKIHEIFHDYTDIIQGVSLDEAYLDVTNCKKCNGSATLIAQEIRERIYQETSLSSSAGISNCKFIAKIASDLNKPNGQYLVSPKDVPAFVENLELKKIPGIGPKTAKKFKEFGLETCKDVREASPKVLKMVAGNFSEKLLELSKGIDNRDVEANRERKSVSVETTFETDLDIFSDCLDEAQKLLPKLFIRMERFENKVIAKQGIKLKFSDFSQTTVECQSNSIDFSVFARLLKKAFNKRNKLKIRLIGLSVGFMPDDKVKQMKNIKQYTLEL